MRAARLAKEDAGRRLCEDFADLLERGGVVDDDLVVIAQRSDLLAAWREFHVQHRLSGRQRLRPCRSAYR